MLFNTDRGRVGTEIEWRHEGTVAGSGARRLNCVYGEFLLLCSWVIDYVMYTNTVLHVYFQVIVLIGRCFVWPTGMQCITV